MTTSPFWLLWSHQLSEKPLQFLFILFAWHDPRLWLSSLLTAGCYKRANDDQEVTNKPSVYRVLARPPHVPPFRNFEISPFVTSLNPLYSQVQHLFYLLGKAWPCNTIERYLKCNPQVSMIKLAREDCTYWWVLSFPHTDRLHFIFQGQDPLTNCVVWAAPNTLISANSNPRPDSILINSSFRIKAESLSLH